MAGFLQRERIVAPPGWSRWLIPPAALSIHLAIGQAYAWSVFKTPLADGLTENAAGRTLYNGNRGLFRKTTLGAVVGATVPAIERRAETAIIPRQHRIIASWPMLMRRLTDRILFRDSAIAKAMSELEH